MLYPVGDGDDPRKLLESENTKHGLDKELVARPSGGPRLPDGQTMGVLASFHVRSHMHTARKNRGS